MKGPKHDLKEINNTQYRSDTINTKYEMDPEASWKAKSIKGDDIEG